MDSPPRPVRLVKEPVGAKNQRKINFVPKDPELLITKPLWEFNASQVPPPRKVATPPFNWKTPPEEMAKAVAIASKPRKSRKSKKSKKSRRTRKN